MTGGEQPAVRGVISSAQLAQTARYILAHQSPDGAIPWFQGEHLDPWDHVEAAMALSVGGHVAEARRAYRWSAENQRADGSWPMKTLAGTVTEPVADTNQCAYLAVGVWHHWRISQDRGFLHELWPAVRAAIDFVVAQQRPAGDIAWAVDDSGVAAKESLLAGNSSIYQALRCATTLADELGRPEPDWELATAGLGHALTQHRENFADRSRYSMDWYYPVLGGAVQGARARAELAARWRDFVRPGWGARCVDDHEWVTGAETCELVLALDACGDTARAHALFADMQHLRHADGGYWTGYVVPDRAVWPEERTTWTAAAVLLAADALGRRSPANGLFRGEGLGPRPIWRSGSCACTDATPGVRR
jgi:hypothetical protein